ncbi:putative cellulose-binding protein [Phaeoacremonium minimum UCRPA7]|uniref:Putative cellulose-binding protein n=1 Tax=Phaeoacremonium minimum (strain UCR-PA7) TaxID=1286976 RepID=R8BR12_PHAM7|nr:putative cellulose-binding protein [Phaeoacremonium minimum UCRPA7]EOO01774.1 putative cellulose-binding protein [Phaeoacremonium minimum UCRPA7]
MKTKVCPQDMEKIIDAYAGAVDNLNKHAHPDSQYASAQTLKGLIRSGPPVYGFAAVGDDIPLSEGGKLLLERIEAPSTQPLWLLCWGGTNVLAQVLLKIRNTYSPSDAAALRAKLRVYTISDQDDTAIWIRTQFPDIFYISSIHGWNNYGMAAWTGISGDQFYQFDQGGPDFSKMTKEWIKENIQIGPLGSAYPDYMFIPEGDTPTFLYLIQNGLGVPEQPDAGSWGGRYKLTDISGAGQKSGHYSDAVDHVVGKDGKTYVSNQATIWRWRDAFQNDFAARIQWTLTPDLAKVNHHPIISIDGNVGTEPVAVRAEAGSVITFDASETYDPDQGDKLTFKWWHYREPSATQWAVQFEVAPLEIENLDTEGRKVQVKIPGPDKCCVELISRKAVEEGQVLHLILEVTDNGTPSLTSYRRIMIQTTNKDLRGGGQGADAIGDLLKT